MKNLTCREIQVDENHNVMILFRNNCYDCYVMRHDGSGETPYFYMFGQLRYQPYAENNTLNDIIDIAVFNAPDYYFLCEDKEEVIP